MSYYDDAKKRLALEDLEMIGESAKAAGIQDELFVGFGLLLGIVREGDFIGHDDDVDMCVLANKVTAEQEIYYFAELAKRGMFFARERWSLRRARDGVDCDFAAIARQARRQEWKGEIPPVGGHKQRIAWFSLRRRVENNKFCHWFMFPWGGYYWHTKAGKWVTRRKFDPILIGYDPEHDDGLMKGIPEQYVNKLIPIDFKGVRLNIPAQYGHCLDFWYPGWLTPIKGGSSSKTVICRVPKWEDETTWKVKVLTPK